jgi:hypothetical protein
VKAEIRVGQTRVEAADVADKAQQRSEPIAAPCPGPPYILDFKHRVPVHTNRSALGWKRSPSRDQPQPLESP